MVPERFLQLQMQLQENNLELQDYIKDLGRWKESMELKDKNLRATGGSQHEIPPIRNSLWKKHKKKRDKTNPKRTLERIKSYDYQAWDKFDVDKALQESDSASPGNHTSSGETDDDQRRIDLSKEARQLGNIRFKEEKFDDAIEHYTLAIRLTPDDPMPYTNRALVFIRLERYASAEADCSMALQLDEKSIKALFRRAMARKHLNKMEEAINDLKRLLDFDPKNKTALKELDELAPATIVKASEFAGTSSNKPFVYNINRKMKRIPITEIGGGLHHEVSTPSMNADLQFQRGDKRANNSNSYLSPEVDSSTSSVTITGASGYDLSSPAITPSVRPLSQFKQPTNWYQLEKDFRELCSRTTNRGCTLHSDAVIYLCDIDPRTYLTVFGHNMETVFLTRLLRSFSQSVQLKSVDILERLNALAKVPRFDIAWMMVDDVDRLMVTDLIKKLSQDGAVDPKIIDNIYSCYT